MKLKREVAAMYSMTRSSENVKCYTHLKSSGNVQVSMTNNHDRTASGDVHPHIKFNMRQRSIQVAAENTLHHSGFRIYTLQFMSVIYTGASYENMH